jgi:hypothetical protein
MVQPRVGSSNFEGLWVRYMLSRITVLCVLVGLLTGLTAMPGGAVAQDRESGSSETGVLVDSLLRDIRDTLIRVRTGTEGNLALRHAKVNLSTVFTTSASGELSLWVVSIGSSISRSATQTLKITLQPPEAGDDLPVAATADALAVAIIEAYEAVRSAELSDPPLRLRELEAAVRFVVEGSGGVQFKILPVTADLSGRISSGSVHEILLVFCPGVCPG